MSCLDLCASSIIGSEDPKSPQVQQVQQSPGEVEDSKEILGKILVCQAGTCRRNGSEAVLMEIEELANSVDVNCMVEASGCLGACNQAPTAIVVTKKKGKKSSWRGSGTKEEYFTHLKSLEKSAGVVKAATGKTPDISSDPNLQTKLSAVRSLRLRNQALSIYRWNEALKETQSQIDSYHYGTTSRGGRARDTLQKLKLEFKSISLKAGYKELPGYNYMNSNTSNDSFPREFMPKEIEHYSQWTLTNISVVSRHSAIFHFISDDRKRGTPHPRGRGRPPPIPITWHTTMLAEVGYNKEGPLPWIERDYTPISGAKEWENGKCDILIKIYKDGAATSWFHRIAIQEQARTNLTFLSSSSTASSTSSSSPELGPQPIRIWFSQPLQTLPVPSLTPTTASASSSSRSSISGPASILLLLAGTGIVALPQLLHHRDPIRNLGISTHRKKQLHIPFDLIFSCREDDVLMLSEIIQLLQEAHGHEGDTNTKGLRHCILLLTTVKEGASVREGEAVREGETVREGERVGETKTVEKGESTTRSQISHQNRYPFSISPELAGLHNEMIQTLEGLPNAQVIYSRITSDILAESSLRMPQPCRYLVSGPSSFNNAIRRMLTTEINVEEEKITILEA